MLANINPTAGKGKIGRYGSGAAGAKLKGNSLAVGLVATLTVAVAGRDTTLTSGWAATEPGTKLKQLAGWFNKVDWSGTTPQVKEMAEAEVAVTAVGPAAVVTATIGWLTIIATESPAAWPATMGTEALTMAGNNQAAAAAIIKILFINFMFCFLGNGFLDTLIISPFRYFLWIKCQGFMAYLRHKQALVSLCYNDRVNGKKHLVWQGLTALTVTAVFVLVGAFATFKINDPDTMQYLAQGRQIVRHGFSKACVFNYTSSDCQIAFNEWGFHVLTYEVYQVGGWVGLNILQLLLALLLFGLLFLYHWYKKANLWAVFLVLLSAAFVAMDRFMLRADLLIMSLAVGQYWLMRELVPRLRQQQTVTWLVIGTLLLQMVWANMHGSFPLGWIIVGAFAAQGLAQNLWQKLWRKQSLPILTQEVKLLLLVLIGSITVSLINPYGLAAFSLPFRFYFGPSQFHNQLEFQGTFTAADFVRQATHVYKWLLIGTAAAMLLNLKRLRLRDIILLLAFGYLSLAHVRYIALFAIMFALIIPVYLNNIVAWIRQWLSRRNQKLRFVSPAAAVVCSLIIIGLAAKTGQALANNNFYLQDQRSRTFGFGLSELDYPAGAVNFINQNHLNGPLFNDYGSGTYLNRALDPSQKTFIDGHSYTLELLQYYNRIVSGEEPFAAVADKYQINYALLNYTYDDTKLLSKQLYNDPAWALVYLDENALIFVRQTPANSELIAQSKIDLSKRQNFDPDHLSRHYSSPADSSRAWSNRGQLLASLNLLPQAVSQFQNAVTADSQNYVAYSNLGALQYQLNQFDEAMASYQKAIAIEPNYAPTQFDLGLYYQSKQDWDHAITAFKKTLKINPRYRFAHYNLGRIYEAQNKTDEAKAEYQAELAMNPGDTNSANALMRLNGQANQTTASIPDLEQQVNQQPNDPNLRVQLGVAYGLQGQQDKAVEQFQKAVSLKPDLVLAHLNLANAYATQNKFVEAAAEYETVAKLDPKNSDAELNLGVIYHYQLHNDDKAVEHWQKFIELAPNDPQAPQIQQLIAAIVKSKLQK